MSIILTLLPWVIGVLLLPIIVKCLGIVIIPENKLGIVIKKFSSKQLPSNKLIACAGESGFQAATLPPGWYFFYFPWQYKINKEQLIQIQQGEIGLIVANDGAELSPNQILGKHVDCNNFQDASAFLTQGGQKGRQTSILTGGTYRINTALFNVITKSNCKDHGMDPGDLEVYIINADNVGIVTTKDGAAIEQGEIAGPIIEGHNNFQDTQKFLSGGGRRGLQEQILLSGSWNLNPWFCEVEQVPMTVIPIGFVGVVISFVGQEHIDVSGTEFKHGDLVEVGHKGIWAKPLDPGKYSLNTKIKKIELVPTTNITLNWANKTEAHKLDEKLSSITVRSKDGFGFNLDVTQIIHIAAPLAPKVIQRIGSVLNLVTQVLEPIIGNYFRNAVQKNTCIEFLNDRSNMQALAKESINKAILEYDVEAVDTLIGDITPPAALMETLTNRKIAEEQTITFDQQRIAQDQRKAFEKSKSEADMQGKLVEADYGVNIASKNAEASIKQSEGEAKGIELKGSAEAKIIQLTGEAQADAYKKGKEAIGEANFSAIKVFEQIGKGNIAITPNILVGGNDNTGSGNGIGNALMAVVMKGLTEPKEIKEATNITK